MWQVGKCKIGCAGDREGRWIIEKEAERTRVATAPTSARHTEAAAGGMDQRAGEVEEDGVRRPSATPGGRATPAATPGATPGTSLEGEDTEPGGAGEAASGGRAATEGGSNGGYVNNFVFLVYIRYFLLFIP